MAEQNGVASRETSPAMNQAPPVGAEPPQAARAPEAAFSSSGPLPQVETGGGGDAQPTASELAFEEQQPAAMELAELAAEAPAPSTPAQKDEKEESYQSVKVPLSDATRAAIKLAYAEYVKSGSVPPIEHIRRDLTLDWLQVAGPMDRARAAMFWPDTYIVNDAGLFPGLLGFASLPVGKARRGSTAQPISFVKVVAKSSLYRDLRVKREEKGKEQGGYDRLDTGASAESLHWIWNLLKGDFNKDPDTAQTVINGLAGLVPGLDQVLDARDMTANLYDLVYEGKYNEAGTWFNFVTTLVGAVPEVGSVIKTVARLGAKSVGNVAQPVLKAILQWTDAGRLTGWVTEQASKSFTSVMANLQLVLETAGKVSSAARAWVTRLLENARAALAQMAERVAAAMQRVKRELDDIVADVRKADNDAPSVKNETPNAPTPTKERVVETEQPKAPTQEAKTEPVAKKPREQEAIDVTEQDPRFKYEDGVRVRDTDSGFWLDRNTNLVDKDGRRVDRQGYRVDDTGKRIEGEGETIASLTPKERLQRDFARVFGTKAIVYRGMLLKPNGEILAKPANMLEQGQMISFDASTALGYARTPARAEDLQEGASEMVIVRFEVTVDQIGPMDGGVLNHAFLLPDIDMKSLPGFEVVRIPRPEKLEDMPKAGDVTRELEEKARKSREP